MFKKGLSKVYIAVIAIVVIVAAVGSVAYYIWFQKSKVEIVRIGVVAPLSGPVAAQGRYLKQGFELAAEDLNAKGGILGRKIELVFGDDQTKPDVAISLIERLITVDKVDFICGGTSSSTYLPTMDVIAKYNVIVLLSIPASSSFDVRIKENPEKYKNIFLQDLNDTVWGSFEILWLSNTIKEGKWHPRNMKVALIAEDTDWGRGVCDTWNEMIRKHGFEVVAYEVVDYGQVDFYSVLTKIKQYDPAIIKAELTGVASGVALVKQVKELGINALLFPGYSAEVHEFEELAGAYADYAIYYGYPVPKKWVDQLLKRFPDSDPTAAFWGYDSLIILADAIEKAGSFDTDKVREALLKHPHKGLWGTYVFDPQTHRAIWGEEYVTPGAVEFYQGKRYFIWPERLKEGEWTYPYHDFIQPPS